MATSDRPTPPQIRGTDNNADRSRAANERLAVGKARLIGAMEPEPRVFLPKVEIPREGEWQNKAYEIVSGWAVRRRGRSDRRNPIVAVHMPGDLFGICELFSGPSMDVIESRGTLSIRSISHADVFGLAAQHAEVAMWLLYYVNQQISQCDNRVTLFASGSALEKVAVLLLDLHRRFSRVGCTGKAPVRIPLTQRDIADYSGLALEYVCRTLAILHERGGITVGYGAVEIIDPDVLVQSAPAMAELGA
jgi:CRP-like cAMP-binding protein